MNFEGARAKLLDQATAAKRAPIIWRPMQIEANERQRQQARPNVSSGRPFRCQAESRRHTKWAMCTSRNSLPLTLVQAAHPIGRVRARDTQQGAREAICSKSCRAKTEREGRAVMANVSRWPHSLQHNKLVGQHFCPVSGTAQRPTNRQVRYR